MNKNIDRASDFQRYIEILKPRLKVGCEREYRFCAHQCGGVGPGIRDRLKKAGLQDWRFDFAWPVHKVAVEIDGGQWMSGGGRHNTDGDRLKLNTAAILGWKVLRFSVKTMQDDPVGCLSKVSDLISQERASVV